MVFFFKLNDINDLQHDFFFVLLKPKLACDWKVLLTQRLRFLSTSNTRVIYKLPNTRIYTRRCLPCDIYKCSDVYRTWRRSVRESVRVRTGTRRFLIQNKCPPALGPLSLFLNVYPDSYGLARLKKDSPHRRPADRPWRVRWVLFRSRSCGNRGRHSHRTRDS